MKYYIYVSDPKVDMLLPQISNEEKRKIASEFKIDLKILSASRRVETEATDNRIANLDAVTAFIREYGNVGNVSNPEDYILDTLPLKISFFEGAVYFGNRLQRTIIGLCGSAKHLLGNEATESLKDNYGSRSHGWAFLSMLREKFWASNTINETYEISNLDLIYWANRELREPTQYVEFLAKRLWYENIEESLQEK